VESLGQHHHIDRSQTLEDLGPHRVLPAGIPLNVPVHIESLNGHALNKWFIFGPGVWECDGDPYDGNWTPTQPDIFNQTQFRLDYYNYYTFLYKGSEHSQRPADPRLLRQADHRRRRIDGASPHFPTLRSDPVALSGASRRKQIPGSHHDWLREFHETRPAQPSSCTKNESFHNMTCDQFFPRILTVPRRALRTISKPNRRPASIP